MSMAYTHGTQFLSYWPKLVASGRMFPSNGLNVDSTGPNEEFGRREADLSRWLPANRTKHCKIFLTVNPDLGHFLRRLTTTQTGPFLLDVKLITKVSSSVTISFRNISISLRFTDRNSVHEVFIALTFVALIELLSVFILTQVVQNGLLYNV